MSNEFVDAEFAVSQACGLAVPCTSWENGGRGHHIAVKTPDFEGTVAMQTEELPLSGSFMDVQVGHLPAARDLGVLLEVFKGDPGTEKARSEGQG